MNVIRSAGEELDTNEDQSDAPANENAVSTTAQNTDERIEITVMNDRSGNEMTSERSRLTTKAISTSTTRLTTNQAETVKPSETTIKGKENLTIKSERTKNGTAVDLARKERIKRELVELQGLFEATMAALSGFKEEMGDPFVHSRVAWRLRTKRADKEMESGTGMSLANSTQPDANACVVRNMTCVKFPSRKHCKGIALGR